MSDFVTANPYAPGTPEWDQANAGALSPFKTIVTSLSKAPSSALSLVVPDPNTGIPFTGAMGQVYEAANGLTNLVTRADPYAGSPQVTGSDYDSQSAMAEWLTGKTPVAAPPMQPGLDLPGHETVAGAMDRVDKLATSLVPAMAAETPADRVGQAIVDGVTKLAIPVPGLSKLPGLLGPTAHALFPGASAPVTLAAMGAGTGAAAGISRELDQPQATPGLDFAVPPVGDVAQPPVIGGDGLPLPPPPPIPPPPPAPSSVVPGLDFDTSSLGTPAAEIDALVHGDGDSHHTWGEFFAYGAAAASLVLGHKVLRATVGDAVTAARERRWNSNMQQEDFALGPARGTTTVSDREPVIGTPPRDVSPIVPEFVAKKSLRLRQQFVDENAEISALNDYHAPDSAAADVLRAQAGTLNNRGYQANMAARIAETGVDNHTGIVMPSLNDAYRRRAKWDVPTTKLFEDARYAADELDNRTRLQQTGGAAAVANPTQTQVGLKRFTDAQLRQQVADGYAHPDVAYELHDDFIRNQRMIDVMQQSGMLSVSDATKIKNQHPNYLPTAGVDGIIENPLLARNLTVHSGQDAAIVPVNELTKQHHEAFFRARDHNIFIRNTVNNILDDYKSQPNQPKIIQESLDTSGPTPKYVQPKDGTGVAFRDNGELKWVSVKDPHIRQAMNSGPQASSTLIKMASIVSSIGRSGTTQGMAALVGMPFAPVNAIRSVPRMAITAPKGTYVGLLDRALQQATSGKLALGGGLDPTTHLAPVIGTAMNAYGVGREAFAHVLSRESTIGRLLRSQYGNAGVDAMHQRAEIALARTTRHIMHEAGAQNAIGQAGAEVGTPQASARSMQYSALNAQVPEMHMTRFGKAGVLGVKLNNLYREISAMVGESTHTFYFGLNHNNPAMVAKYGAEGAAIVNVHRTRQLTGDIGQRGGNQAVREYNSVAKYTNVAIQDIANLTDAAARAPFTTALKYGTAIGIPVAASVFSAMVMGPNAVKHMEQELSADAQAQHITFYTNSEFPERSPSISLPQTERGGATLLKQLMFDAFNLQAREGDSTYEWAKHGLADLFAKHVTQSTWDGAAAGLKSAVSIPLPDIAQVGLAAAGVRGEFNPLDLAFGSGSIGSRITVPLRKGDANLPGVANDHDPNGDMIGNQTFWNILGAVIGASAATIQGYKEHAESVSAKTEDSGAVIRAFMTDYKHNVESRLPFGRGLLWTDPDKLSANMPLAKSVRDASNAFRPLLSADSDLKNEGLTRPKGMVLEPVAGGREDKLPTDPVMRDLYFTASDLGKKIFSGDKSAMREVEDWRKMLQQIPKQGLSQEETRAKVNQYTRNMNNALSIVGAQITDANSVLSQRIGKAVEIQKIKWDKGVEQFND